MYKHLGGFLYRQFVFILVIVLLAKFRFCDSKSCTRRVRGWCSDSCVRDYLRENDRAGFGGLI